MPKTDMPTFYPPLTLAARSGLQREGVLKQELEILDPGLLHLREAMAQGNLVAAEPVRVMMLTSGGGGALLTCAGRSAVRGHHRRLSVCR